LLYRYATSSDGKLKLKAKIYISSEHKIVLEDIDYDAVDVIKNLTTAGFKAYVVGGAVRDLLLGKHPKDFDIATNARPNQIKRFMHRARIIGRRFKIVHVYYGRDKVIEVSTFRSEKKGSLNNNIYGTLGEDAFRRDFSMNALFYCPLKQQIIDYVDGYRDIQHKIVRSLSLPKKSFKEDPVRMLRAVKYAALSGFVFSYSIRFSIMKLNLLLNECSNERLTEEIYKILQSGRSEAIVKSMLHFKLLDVLLPSLSGFYAQCRKSKEDNSMLLRLERLDSIIQRKKKISRGEMLSNLLLDLAPLNPQWKGETLDFLQKQLREKIKPLCPSNKDLRAAARILKSFLLDVRDTTNESQRRVSIR
jgi:poly(A) polymerase